MNRNLIRFAPYFLSVFIIVIIYFLLEKKMNVELEEAKSDLKKGHVESVIMELDMLELMHYKFKDVLFYKDLKGFLDKEYDIPDSEPIVIVNGVSIGGIDFSKVHDIVQKNDSLILRIPKAEFYDYELEDEIKIITDYEISEEEIKNAIKKISSSEQKDLIHPLEIEINHEHMLKILEPVLENMAGQELYIEFDE